MISPIIALTCGEPAGIGPEIGAAAWAALKSEMTILWIGDPAHLPPGLPIKAVAAASDAPGSTDALAVLPLKGEPARPGEINPANAPLVVEAIDRAVAMAGAGEVAAVCTNPINKKALREGAGFAHRGHTEYLAHLAGTKRATMMLACPELRVVPVTVHEPLANVPRILTPALIEYTIRTTLKALIRDFGVPSPRLAVAGLNPHAGEGGEMGMEEINIISPTLDALRAEGFDLAGPVSADTMFHPAARLKYDAAVCMYHDQALIPIKTVDFSGGVNVTLGLPFVRTSPDHGTALDIAGQGVADAGSLIAALRLARDMAAARGRALSPRI